MLNDLLLITLIVFALWLVSFGLYLVVSRRQRKLDDEIVRLKEMLGGDEEQEPGDS